MIKKYHVSANLLDIEEFARIYPNYCTYQDSTLDIFSPIVDLYNTGITVDIPANTFFSCTPVDKTNAATNGRIRFVRDDNTVFEAYITDANGDVYTSTQQVITTHIKAIRFNWSSANSGFKFKFAMINNGSTALPYEPYGNSFKDWFYREYGTETETFTTLPKTIIGDGQNISAWSMKGNMSQSGTPTPSNPIYPTECGDKTANLFNYATVTTGYRIIWGTGAPYADATGIISDYIEVEEGQEYRISDSTKAFTAYVIGYNQNKEYLGVYNSVEGFVKASSNKYNRVTIPISSDCKYIKLMTFADNDLSQTSMFTKGSTAPSSYIPFGYKIPISLSQNTYNIYITEPLRKSLDGSNVYDTIESNGTLTRRVDANGDALATPTTEQVTVPTLTTTGTAEQFNVLTTLAPSEVSLTYHGWHEHSDTKFTTP